MNISDLQNNSIGSSYDSNSGSNLLNQLSERVSNTLDKMGKEQGVQAAVDLSTVRDAISGMSGVKLPGMSCDCVC